MQTLPELLAERNSLLAEVTRLRLQISVLTTENLKLRQENSELRSQLEWHPIGEVGVVAPGALHSRETLPLGESEVPPPIAAYVHDPRVFLERAD